MLKCGYSQNQHVQIFEIIMFFTDKAKYVCCIITFIHILYIHVCMCIIIDESVCGYGICTSVYSLAQTLKFSLMFTIKR